MKIAIECGLKRPLPVLRYGGTQRVVWDLAKALSAMGHEITLLAAPGTHCPFAARILNPDPMRPVEEQLPPDLDIVHFQNRNTEQIACSLPYVNTVHGNLKPGTRLDRNTIFVSQNMATRYGATAFVHNGTDWERVPNFSLEHPREYYHFLGKGSWRVKNLRGAIDILRKTRTETLHVLGAKRFDFRHLRFYFSPRTHFHGMVDDATKARIMLRSKGLIFPVLWHEPFGLAITESLYCGCPVFGTPMGSLPELVPSTMGYLSQSPDDLRAHLHDFDDPASRRLCHEYAADTFSAQAMATHYLAYYERVLNGQACNETPPFA